MEDKSKAKFLEDWDKVVTAFQTTRYHAEVSRRLIAGLSQALIKAGVLSVDTVKKIEADVSAVMDKSEEKQKAVPVKKKTRKRRPRVSKK